MLILTGSYDNTVRVWNAYTRWPVGDLFQRYVDGVTSVVFSADSKLIVTGSNDNTVCIWNTPLGKLVGGPFRGHTILALSHQ